MTLFRRFLALAALMVWQGGFIFYAAIVVPLSTSVLGSSLRQGVITRRVTETMNVCGVFALALVAWDLGTSRDLGILRHRTRIVLFVLMGVAAIMLFRLHGSLGAIFDDSDFTDPTIVDRHAFRPLHRLYLWTSTVQWGCAVVYLLLTLAAWREEDRQPRGNAHW
jgi:hypothetical protein